MCGRTFSNFQTDFGRPGFIVSSALRNVISEAGYARSRGAAPNQKRLDGSAERLRTSVGIAESPISFFRQTWCAPFPLALSELTGCVFHFQTIVESILSAVARAKSVDAARPRDAVPANENTFRGPTRLRPSPAGSRPVPPDQNPVQNVRLFRTRRCCGSRVFPRRTSAQATP